MELKPATDESLEQPRPRPSSSSAIRKSIHRCRKSISSTTSRILETDRFWVSLMFTLGTFDMVLNFVNFIQMSDDNLAFGLVIGPPSFTLWCCLCFFTVTGTLLYIPETINTFSVLHSPSRKTFIPIHFEMIATLLFEHIPLSTVDYFIARCRRQYTTYVESSCNSLRIVFVLMRLIWYAHLEGRSLKQNDKYRIKQNFVMICWTLFSVSISFTIMNWRFEPDIFIKRYHLINVSIFMLNHERPPEQLKFNISITDILKLQGHDVEKPWLIESAMTIYDRRPGRVMSEYLCHPNISQKPVECGGGTSLLRFTFAYSASVESSPYGEIGYNFARIVCNDTDLFTRTDIGPESKCRNIGKCTDSTEKLMHGWKLFYFEAHRSFPNQSNPHDIEVEVSAPFRKSFTHPMPKYNPSMKVCRNDSDAGDKDASPVPATTKRRRLKRTKNRPDGGLYDNLFTDFPSLAENGTQDNEL